MIHGHEQKLRDQQREWEVLGAGGQREDNYNSIFNKRKKLKMGLPCPGWCDLMD